MGRVLGLDVGERRIGVAISTPEGTLAVPLRIIERAGDARDAAAVADVARAEQVDAIVVGLPRSLNGSIGPQARRVQAFADEVAAACGLPIDFQDERLSSVQAERGAPRRSRRDRGARDDIAAAIILQNYLDRQRSAEERREP